MLRNTPALRLPPDGLLEENPNDKPPVATPPNPGPLPNAAERQRGHLGAVTLKSTSQLEGRGMRGRNYELFIRKQLFMTNAMKGKK